MLDTVHHQGIRLSLGAFRTSPVESLYAEANEESLYRRRERQSLQYATKLSSNPNNPTFDTVFRPKYSEIFAISPNAISTFGLRIKDLIDEANINIETIRQATIPESPPWQLESPLIIYGLKTVKKVDTNPLVLQGLFNDVQDKYFDHQFLYTDGSKDDHKVGCAVVSNFNIVKRRLPGQTSIYTAELCTIQLALDVVNNSNEDKYIICVYSLSCLQAIEQQHIDHPLVLDVLEKYSALINKTVLFCWVPSHWSYLQHMFVAGESEVFTPVFCRGGGGRVVAEAGPQVVAEAVTSRVSTLPTIKNDIQTGLSAAVGGEDRWCLSSGDGLDKVGHGTGRSEARMVPVEHLLLFSEVHNVMSSWMRPMVALTSKFFLSDEGEEVEMPLHINDGRPVRQRKVYFRDVDTGPQMTEGTHGVGPTGDRWDGQRILDTWYMLCKWMNTQLCDPETGLELTCGQNTVRLGTGIVE